MYAINKDMRDYSDRRVQQKNYANYHESGQMFNEWRLRWLANSIAREESCKLLRRWLNIYSATLKQILLKLSEFYQG